MTKHLRNQLTAELKAFAGLEPASNPKTDTDTYNRILDLVQALMLTNEDPDSHARAWNLLNEGAYKDLADFQGGNKNGFPDLKHKIERVGEVLSIL